MGGSTHGSTDRGGLPRALVVELLRAVAAAEAPEPRGRIQAALAGLCAVVGADLAVAADMRVGASVDADGPPIVGRGELRDFIECGSWTLEQRQIYLDYLSGNHNDDVFLGVCTQRLARAPLSCTRLTWRRRELVGDRLWYSSPHYARVRVPIGLDACVYTFMRTGSDGRWWAAGIHRRTGRPPFTARERDAIGIFCEGVLPLFAALDGAPSGATRVMAGLPRRMRELMLALNSGRSAKQIAADLGLTESTVNTYAKRLYRRLGVSGRAEMQTLCQRLGVVQMLGGAPETGGT